MDRFGRRGEPDALIECPRCNVLVHPDGWDTHQTSSRCRAQFNTKHMETAGFALKPRRIPVTVFQEQGVEVRISETGYDHNKGLFSQTWVPLWSAELLAGQVTEDQSRQMLDMHQSSDPYASDALIAMSLMVKDSSDG